jgi:hypothetical protein
VSAVYSELQAVDGKINTAISNAGHLKYTVVQNLSDATATNTIYLHAKSTTSENDIFEEFMYVNGSLEKIGNFSIDLTNYATATAVSALDTRIGALELQTNTYVTSATFSTVVGNLNILNSYTTATNIVDSIKDIYDRLIWIELIDEE